MRIERQKSNLERPATIHEARTRLERVDTEIAVIDSELRVDFRLHDDGTTMTDEEFVVWRKRAAGARHWFITERTLLHRYIKEYERDIRTEEQDAVRQKKAEREAKKQHHIETEKELQKERMEKDLAFKNGIISEYGEDVFKAAEQIASLELQVVALQKKLENIKAQCSKLISDAKKKNQAHKDRLNRLTIDESVEGLDADNLLRHAYRLFSKLRNEGRVSYSAVEQDLLTVLEQRELFLEAVQNNEEET